MHTRPSKDEQTKLVLILKYGSMENAFTEFLGVARAYTADGFTPDEFNCMAEYEYWKTIPRHDDET